MTGWKIKQDRLHQCHRQLHFARADAELQNAEIDRLKALHAPVKKHLAGSAFELDEHGNPILTTEQQYERYIADLVKDAADARFDKVGLQRVRTPPRPPHPPSSSLFVVVFLFLWCCCCC
jgi:hypothetical protein